MIPEEPAPPAPPKGLLRSSSLRSLRHRDFALVWSAALVSNIGTWVQTVAIGVLITQLTGQARWTGLVAAAAFLPIGLLSPLGGAIADRADRRSILLVATLGEVTFASTLAVLALTDSVTPVNLTALAFAGGCMAAFAFPAFQAILPDLVPREDLLGAISLSSAQYNLGRVVGPALAGLVLVGGSFSLAFVVNAVSFGGVFVAIALVRLPPPRPDPDESGGVWRQIVTGASGAWAEPGCRLAIATIGVGAFFLSPFIALIPAVAIQLFDAGESGTSILVTAQGVGAVAGALALAPLAERFGRRRLLVGDLMLLPVLIVLYGVAPTLLTATLALAAVGAGYIGILSGLSTVVQLRAPTHLRARILSLYMVALGTVYPIGAIVQGALGDRFGLRAVTVTSAIAFAALVLVTVGLRPQLVSSLDDPLRAQS